MSDNPVRDALQAHLSGMVPAIDTVWENPVQLYEPVDGQPYQRVDLIPARPANNETGSAFMEQGFMQVRLCYPLGRGPSPLEARFFAIRARFKNGSSLPAVAGVVTNISGTPELGPQIEEPGRYCRPVRIPFHAHFA